MTQVGSCDRQSAAAQGVVIIGSGIAGLATALALSERGLRATLVERDPPPPDIPPQDAFERWQRPGVPQFRHAHMFLARLQTTLRDRHPALLRELLEAGLELSTLPELLPESHLDAYTERPEDADLLHLWGRRATFEYVLRGYVGRQPGVGFVHDAQVRGLRAEVRDAAVHVSGVEVTQDGLERVIPGELVVDAAGKSSRADQWLRALGVAVESRSIPTERTYVCRHFRLRDPQAGPPRVGTGANHDFFGYATFYAEHGHYAITFSCPDRETDLARSMCRPPGFDALCESVPVLARWVAQSDATTKVLGARGFANTWTRYGARGGRELVGFVPAGDSHIETNPMYGRGCASAFLQAQALGEALDAAGGVRRLAPRYYARTHALMKPHFDFCVSGDEMFRSRGRLSRGEGVTTADRLLRYAYEELWTPAMQASLLCAREMIKAMEMRELSGVPTRLAVLLQIVWHWLVGRSRRQRTPALPPAPPRAELLDRLRRALHAQDPRPPRPASAPLVRQTLAQEGQRRSAHEAAERVEQPHR